MLYLDLFYTFISKMCPEVSEKPKRAHKGIVLSVKRDVIKHFDRDERNKDIVCMLNFGFGNA